MIRIFLRVAKAAAALCLAGACSVVARGATTQSTPQAAASCAGGTSLNGSYGIMVTGGRYLTGVVNFNGNCALTGTHMVGGLSEQAVSGPTTATGTYVQNSDGTFDLTLTLANASAPQTYTINVGASGIKASGVESDNTAAATIDIESQLTNLTNGYTTASLSGKYALSCQGEGSDLNYVNFDGKGNLTGVDPYDNGGSQGNGPYAGTYTVNPDGSFTTKLTGGDAGYTTAGVLDTGVSELQYTYSVSGTEVVGCEGRQAAAPALSGYYGMLVGGVATNGGGGGKYLSGAVHFDGKGNISATHVNGGINTQVVSSTATGTYVVNSDNTLTITLKLSGQTTAQTYIVAVSAGGNEAVGLETDGTAQATIDLQAQLVTTSTSYSNASMNGTYASYCTGSALDTNYVTFDGKGNQSGVDPYDNGGYGDNPYVGTYSVSPDGTFSGAFTGPIYSVYTLTGVIDNLTSELEWTYVLTGTGGISACKGFSTYGPVGTAPVAATPAFSPAPRAYAAAQTVTLTSSTPGAKIYYTTNGVTPTTASLPYSKAITVNPNTTIEAIAVASGYNNSAISAGTYFAGTAQTTAATPTFTPLPGTFNSAQSVKLADSTTGAVIHYTLDGTTPTTNSAVYSTAIPVSTTTTIHAIAIAAGYTNSAVATGVYTIAIAGFTLAPSSPTLTLAPGGSGSVKISAAAVNGFSGVITFSLTGLPTGVTYSFAPASSSTGTTLTISVPAGTAGGNFPLTVKGASGSIAASTTVNLVLLQAQTITFTKPVAQVTGTPLTLSAKASSGLPVSYASSTPTVCMVSGVTASFLSAGTCTLTASQPGNTTYAAATAVTQSFAVSSAIPPAVSVQVNLSSVYNVWAIDNNGVAPIYGGFDGSNDAYSENLLGTSVTALGVPFTLGAPGVADAVSILPIPLPAGSFSTLSFLAAANYGNQVNAVFVLTYTDGTTSTVTQSISDWGNPQSYAGETVAAKMAYRIKSGGVQDNTPYYVYAYSIPIPSGKVLKSIAIPQTRNIVVMAMTLTQLPIVPVNLASAFNVYAIDNSGVAPTNGGFDTSSYAYSANGLPSAISLGGAPVTLGPTGSADAVSSSTVILPPGSFAALDLLAAAANGPLLNQSFVVTYTDGTTSTFTQNMSDWGYPQNYTGETSLVSEATRVAPSGAAQTGPWYMYGYTLQLNPAKTVSSITLPSNRNASVFAITLLSSAPQ